MTTTPLEGNCVGWNTSQLVSTQFQDKSVLPNGRAFSWAVFDPITTNDAASRSQNAPGDGKVVGMVYHCEENTSVFPMTVNWLKNGVVITAMTITVPAGATGYFFSDPTVSEFTREFVAQDEIYITIKKDPSEGISPGTQHSTLMVLVEIEFAAIPPLF